MYSSTPSLSLSSSSSSSTLSQSVLSQFPPDAAHAVVNAVVKSVASQLGIGVIQGAVPSTPSVSSAVSVANVNFVVSGIGSSTSSLSGAGLVGGQQPPALKNEAQITWFMEVVCHGLSLPLIEHDTIKDCVNIYCEWLSALLPVSKPCVPQPIVEEPNRYARKIIGHLYHLFVPRRGEEEKLLALDKSGKLRQAAQETIHKQAVLCHRVLRRVQDVVQQSQIMDRETWEALLAFLLAINDALLAPPTVKDDVGDQLCERVLGVLYEIWLVACVKCFPSPPLWKTFREMCMNWRHRTGLVDQWNRVNLALTARLLSFMYGPEFPKMKIPDEDANLVPSDMTNDCIAQSWYRFIHSLGNPVELCRPALVSQTQHFYQYAIVAENVIDPTHHPCLSALPGIFLKSMKGVAAMVDAYLGIFVALDYSEYASSCYVSGVSDHYLSSNSSLSAAGAESLAATVVSSPMTPTPTLQRRSIILGHMHLPHLRRTPPLDKIGRIASAADITSTSSFDMSAGLPKASQFIGLTRSSSSTATHLPPSTSLGSSTNLIGFTGLTDRPTLASSRPKCNSLLHLFGKWLFEAAYIGTAFSADKAAEKLQQQANSDNTLRPVAAADNHQQQQLLQQHQQAPLRRTSSSSQQQSSLTGSVNESLDLPAALTPERFEAGRAEAIGTLCRIFCSKKTGEEILPVYLARFYLAIQQGLIISPDKVVSEVLAMILVNSFDLLRLDLDGVHVLLPYLVTALEAVLPERELKLRPTSVPKNELRRAGINILVSMLALPSHFQNLPIKELSPGAEQASRGAEEQMTFISLKPRLFNLVINALQVEQEALNTQLLLGGLMFLVEDAATLEELEAKHEGAQQSRNSAQFDRSTMAPATSLPSGDGGNGKSHGSDSSRDDTKDDTAHAVFVRATYLVCHRLISTWKTDLNTSLAALELLSGLAKVKIPEQDPLESKRAVKWICDYIVTQCSRPPPAHSKDLHSSIVAAFRCLSTWLLCHSYLLQDKECIATVMEVVEQGISGSKSKNKASDEPVFKEDKFLSPASRRVRDAAESLLTCILEQVDYFPSACGAESISSLLDEVSLLQHCNTLNPDEMLPMSEAVQNFRYFVVDNSTVLAILEEPLGNAQEPQPTVSMLLRTSANRSAWTMQLRQLPRHKSGLLKTTQVNPGRPLPMGETGGVQSVHPKFFPDSIDQIPLCKADKSIPAVESVAGDERSAAELEHLSRLMEHQSLLEEQVVARLEENTGYRIEGECQAPVPSSEFQTARLILSHLGLLNMGSLRETVESSVPPRLIALESDVPAFVNDLEALDRLSPRTADTVHMFYVKSGQRSRDEILQNVHSCTHVHPHFLSLLSSLGWPVNVWQHPGWTGHISNSWRGGQTEPMTPPQWNDHGGAIFNGDHNVLYWADAAAEIAFVVPSNKPRPQSRPMKSEEDFNKSAGSSDTTTSTTASSLTLDLAPALNAGVATSGGAPDLSKRKVMRQTSTVPQQDMKMLVVWLERMEDHADIPIEDLLGETLTGTEGATAAAYTATAKDAFVIYIQPMKSGLMRIKMLGQTVKMNLATPLVDGMIVSRRCLGPLVRQTALNVAARRRLEVDSYHPPHVRRKLKVQEIVQKYRSHMTEPEFYAHLFSPPFI